MLIQHFSRPALLSHFDMRKKQGTNLLIVCRQLRALLWRRKGFFSQNQTETSVASIPENYFNELYFHKTNVISFTLYSIPENYVTRLYSWEWRHWPLLYTVPENGAIGLFTWERRHWPLFLKMTSLSFTPKIILMASLSLNDITGHYKECDVSGLTT